MSVKYSRKSEKSDAAIVGIGGCLTVVFVLLLNLALLAAAVWVVAKVWTAVAG